ncbi:MAG: hypothetical protein ACI94Y_003396 [Maribacter sp.]
MGIGKSGVFVFGGGVGEMIIIIDERNLKMKTTTIETEGVEVYSDGDWTFREKYIVRNGKYIDIKKDSMLDYGRGIYSRY